MPSNNKLSYSTSFIFVLFFSLSSTSLFPPQTASIHAMASLQGKVIALTGAASGMGEATAHLLAARGAKISLADVQEAALHAVRDAILAKTPDAEILFATVDVRNWKRSKSGSPIRSASLAS